MRGQRSQGQERVRYVLADVGSTTTKVIALGGDPLRILAQAAHPTTVEPPLEDAFIGFERGVEALGLGLPPPGTGEGEDTGAGFPDVLFTSSAAGGLKILVAGLVRSITAESAQRASMGAGGVILDVLAADDGRTAAAKADLTRSVRPDLVLVAGGFEGSRGEQILQTCEILAMGASGETRTPLIFAGSAALAEAVEDILTPYYDVRVAPNLRPGAGQENFAPVTQAIQEVFMEHVMAHAPGYGRISGLARAGVIPTPFGVGRMLRLLAEDEQTSVLAFDIGGATTDVFSVSKGVMLRTVSASLGMSYSLGNTLVEAGVDNFRRWMEPAPDERTLRNAVYRKVVNPTRFPETELEWQVDLAGGIEALRMALAQHVELAVTLSPVRASGPFVSREEAVLDGGFRKRRLQLKDVGLIIGSGGCLAYARSPRDATRILLESIRPEGVTRLVLDTRSLLSHFGNLSRVDEAAALALCRANLTELATLVAPVGATTAGKGVVRWVPVGVASDALPPGEVDSGQMVHLPVAAGSRVEVRLEPSPGLDLGLGAGNPVTVGVGGSKVGLIIDLRGQENSRSPSIPAPASRHGPPASDLASH